MKPSSLTSAAVDLGATSGRVIVGTWSRGRVSLKEVHRFPNHFRSLAGNDYWDVGTLWHEVQEGLAKARAAFPKLASVGVDTWGVDYALVGKGGRLAAPVHAYRDLRTAKAHRALKGRELEKVYELTGIPNFIYNSSLQLRESLRAFPGLAKDVQRCLFLPDYFNFLLTGVMKNEVSISSHSQLLDVHGDTWSPAALAHFGIPAHWFTPAASSPGRLGTVTSSSALKGVEGVLVPGHDTACAFTAMPAADDGLDLYLSSGTWSLLGFESRTPVLGKEALAAKISNERMGAGHFRPLCSGLGLWLLERVLDETKKRPKGAGEWKRLVSEAEALPVSKRVLDLEDSALFNPTSMVEALAEQAKSRGIRQPTTIAAYMRLVVDSIAAHQAEKVRLLGRLSGRSFRRILMVGGGSNNPVLCQAIANATKLPVVSLQLEGSAMGNLATQWMALGAFGSLQEFRSQVADQLHPKIYSPQSDSQ